MPIMPLFVELAIHPVHDIDLIVCATSAVYRILENVHDSHGLIMNHLLPDATDSPVYGFRHQYIASNKSLFCVALDETS
jgi:hypothetical protein